MAPNHSIASTIEAYLTEHNLPPSQPWFDSFISNARLSTPLPALQKTALFRLLASDITTSIKPSPSNTLPRDSLDPKIKEQTLPGSIVVQLLDIEDIGRSKWSQVESLEAQERGEQTKGREIIRLVPGEIGENGNIPDANAAGKVTGPHKLLLQDAKGTKIYAFEMTRVDGIALSMTIGTKLVLKRPVVARGLILLDSSCVDILGGKVDSWDKSWRAGRKDRLRAAVGATDDD
ncbi:hypothetical protein BDV97DRAFT_131741 [Delphinella strobiligena]|nr:hypothetical protein BDV97DRAFT_131741 [Delphinella strobiligena]